MTLTLTTNVKRKYWKSNLQFSNGTILLPAGGSYEIEYPTSGTTALLLTIYGDPTRTYEYSSSRYSTARKEIRLAIEIGGIRQTLSAEYKLNFSGPSSDYQFVPI